MLRVVIYVLLLFTTMYAKEANIKDLLGNIEKKTDLSSKTKLENGGISTIYTREDLRRMQVHNLKDVLKTLYPYGYNENDFGLSDPYAMPRALPYMSSDIKIYIDNQEITTGLYGSGVVIYGNMDIDFVDHIEIYIGNPTYKFSTEPAYTLIKLYSKGVQKDQGNKIALGGGSRGTKRVMAYRADQFNNGWSYFSYINHNDNKREKYHNGGATLSRDIKTTHFFNAITKKSDKIILDAVVSQRDAFRGWSIFATPKKSTIENNYLHIGYDTKKGNLSFLISLDASHVESNFEDLNKQLLQQINQLHHKNFIYEGKTKSNAEVYTTGLNYKIDFHANKLLLGVKYRLKHFVYESVNFNNVELPKSGNTKQMTTTQFIENQYSLAKNKIITMGVSFYQVRNNHSNQDNNLFSYRAGYTYTNKNLVSKTVASYLETTVDPYLVNSIYVDKSKLQPSKFQIFMQNIKYKHDSNIYEITGAYIIAKNRLFPDQTTALLANYKKAIIVKNLFLRYTKNYNQYDKLECTFDTDIMNNLPFFPLIQEYASSIKNFNTYKKFDIFNELIFYRNDDAQKSYYDYSAGIIYHKTDDLSFAIEGNNLLNQAKQTSYYRVNPQTLQQDEPLKISPIDTNVMLSMEYTF